MKKCTIISGFAAIGKSKFVEHFPYFENVRVYDLPSSCYRKNPGWERYYCDAVEALARNNDYVFITAHDIIIKEMIRRRVPFFIVYPKKSCKMEYLDRFRARGDSEEYITKFARNWDHYIDLLDNLSYPYKVSLRPGQYLSDVINRLR